MFRSPMQSPAPAFKLSSCHDVAIISRPRRWLADDDFCESIWPREERHDFDTPSARYTTREPHVVARHDAMMPASRPPQAGEGRHYQYQDRIFDKEPAR